jgi:hypothetical protein
MLGKPWIDLGIHPDALETPAEYGALLKEQCDWFRRLTGKPPDSFRNHGFLNDGYWRHLPHWLDEGVRISSNLPGLDGRVLNGSLLPARLAYDDRLTNHWSILTAFGDGMIFALGMTDAEAGARVHHLAGKVIESGIPGIIVLNLHPQNVAETRAIHRAALDVIDDGFVAWTLRDCLNWFDAVDAGHRPREHAGITDRLRTWLHRRLRRCDQASAGQWGCAALVLFEAFGNVGDDLIEVSSRVPVKGILCLSDVWYSALHVFKACWVCLAVWGKG